VKRLFAFAIDNDTTFRLDFDRCSLCSSFLFQELRLQTTDVGPIKIKVRHGILPPCSKYFEVIKGAVWVTHELLCVSSYEIIPKYSFSFISLTIAYTFNVTMRKVMTSCTALLQVTKRGEDPTSLNWNVSRVNGATQNLHDRKSLGKSQQTWRWWW